MKILISVFIFSMLTYASKCMGQHKDNFIAIEFDVDGKLENVKGEMEMFFIRNTDTLLVKTKDGYFFVPDELKDAKATIVFNILGYHLTFESIPITWNAEMPKWVIGVDTKPFDMDKFFFIKKVKKWRKIKIVYFLQNGTGSQITCYRYK